MNQTELIARVRRNAMLEDTNVDYTDQVILDELNDALYTKFQRLVLEADSGFWTKQYTFTTTQGVASYRMPVRAISLSKVEIATTTSNANQYVRLPQVSEGHVGIFQAPDTTLGNPAFWLARGDEFVIVPTPDNGAYSIRVTYFLRPSTLILPQAAPTTAGVITAVSSTTGVVTISSLVQQYVNGAMSNITAGTFSFDIVAPYAWYDAKLVGLAPQSTVGNAAVSGGGTTLTFVTPSTLANVQVGDIVRWQGQTDWPALEVSFHRCLADVATAKILLQRDYQQKASGYVQDVSSDLSRFSLVIQQRVIEEPYTVRADLPSLRRRW